jgi:dienelactone hydrolase
MIAPLAKWIDRLFIQKSFMRMPSPDARTLRMEETIRFLKTPDFIPGESQPAQVEFNPARSERHFFFSTPRPSAFAENNVVHGRLYRCAGRWRERPVILLLHGGNIMRGRSRSLAYQFGYPLIARHCNRAGFNAATLEMPYNFQRHPRQPGALKAEDYLRMAEATAQAIAEIRALTGWLLEQGCPAVALWGVSMGGWLAGMTVCRDARLAAVVMTLPTVRSNAVLAEQIIQRSLREAWRPLLQVDEALDTTPFNLTSAQPAIPRENILLIGGIHDLLCPIKPIEELCQLWGQPDLWRLPHGHISFMSDRGLTGRVLRWLTPRLDARSSANPTSPNHALTPNRRPAGQTSSAKATEDRSNGSGSLAATVAADRAFPAAVA